MWGDVATGKGAKYVKKISWKSRRKLLTEQFGSRSWPFCRLEMAKYTRDITLWLVLFFSINYGFCQKWYQNFFFTEWNFFCEISMLIRQMLLIVKFFKTGSRFLTIYWHLKYVFLTTQPIIFTFTLLLHVCVKAKLADFFNFLRPS